jgi:hypothetical protein
MSKEVEFGMNASVLRAYDLTFLIFFYPEYEYGCHVNF